VKIKLIIGGLIALALLIAGGIIGWWLHPNLVTPEPVVKPAEEEEFVFSGQAEPYEALIDLSETITEEAKKLIKGRAELKKREALLNAKADSGWVCLDAGEYKIEYDDGKATLTKIPEAKEETRQKQDKGVVFPIAIKNKLVYESYKIPPQSKREGKVSATAKGTFNIYGNYNLSLDIQTDPDTVQFEGQIPPVKPRKEKSSIRTFSPVFQLSYAPFSKSVGVGCGVAVKRRIYFLLDVEAKKLDKAEVFGRVGIIF